MLDCIEFKSDKFETKDEENILCELTNNTIILCDSYETMDFIANEILNTINLKVEHNKYSCDVSDVENAKMELAFGLQRVIDINGQKITLALEPSIIYKSTSVQDIWFIWFIDYENYNKFAIYALSMFKDCDKDYENLDVLYKNIINGQYGCFDGKWVK